MPTLSPPSLEQKLTLIEALITSRRRNIAESEISDDDQMLDTLRSIAADLRDRSPGAAVETRRVLGEKIAAFVRSHKGPGLGWQSGKLLAIGQEVVGRWRTIEAALERHGVDLPPDAVEVALDVDYYAFPRRPIE
jgi:hypothetical protein